MKHNVYLLSGLGADESVFKHLRFPQSQICHVKWPNVTKETDKESFLSAIKDQITTKKNNVLLGGSFGGLVAQDIAQSLPIETLIIVSSVIDSSEIPNLYKGALSRLFLKITPSFLLNKPSIFLNYLFSTRTAEGREALQNIIRNTNPASIRWAINYVQQWNKPTGFETKKIYRIHGKNDRIFPNVNSNIEIETIPGGHFAIFENASEVNALLKSWL